MIAAVNELKVRPSGRQPVEDQEELHQQRGAADDRDVEPGQLGHHRDRRQPHQRHDQRDRQADDEADDRERDGRLDRGQQHRSDGALDQLPGALHLGPVLVRGRGLLTGRHVGVEVALGDLGQGAVGAQLVQGLVDRVAQGAVLGAQREHLLARVAGLGGDLDVGVLGGLDVLQHRQVVVDGGVHPPLLDQGDGLGEALDGLDLRPGVGGHLGPVAGRALRRGLALQVGERA